MKRAAALVSAALLAACQPAAAPPAATAPAAPASTPAAATSAALQFARAGDTIEVRRGADVLQRLQIPASAEAPEIEVLDMNFDGAPDLRVIDVRPAGPNVRYVNWLFDPAGQRFVRSAALDELPAPAFDAARREVLSSWRDGATQYGRDTYAFRGGELVPQARELRAYSAPGVYTLKRSRWADGGWQLVETTQGRGEPP
ncbi:hypothetical protein [Pseudorhodoferax sp. Leaf267]|uniref:XAC2610-related protein n=1 Tax=Pseudorhodoferax sp. Leaf267 TaxID=1736316 RepID=UPI0006FA24DB|nr:hypothetical protein [Pseudorhodoferax sp. Leaf267]KQP20003.1 hypothetical protein ASF43_27975 [Pseudorhodoferax sp. Leaf267]